MPLEESESCSNRQGAFRKRGIKQGSFGASPLRTPTDAGVRVHLEGGKTVEAELLLVAIGRGPVLGNAGYEQVGIG